MIQTRKNQYSQPWRLDGLLLSSKNFPRKFLNGYCGAQVLGCLEECTRHSVWYTKLHKFGSGSCYPEPQCAERETLDPQVRVQAHGQGEVSLCSRELTGVVPTGLSLQGLCVMSATNDMQAWSYFLVSFLKRGKAMEISFENFKVDFLGQNMHA